MSTTTAPVTYIGLDIAKDSIELSGLPRGSNSLPNNASAHRRLIKRLRNHPGSIHLILEPTGGYERALVRALHRAEIAVSVVNPRKVRDFARASGLLAKTDKLDASVLARYGATFEPKPTLAPSPSQAAVQALERFRLQLEQDLHREQNRLEHASENSIQSLLRRRIAATQRDLKRVQSKIDKQIEEDDDLNTKSRRLQAVKGVGPRTATGLLAELPELGQANRKQIASLAGLAPVNRDSGSFRGRRFIAAGRPAVRRYLYMSALVATRYNEDMRAFYERLLGAGKAKKCALVAVMRKLLITLNAILKQPMNA